MNSLWMTVTVALGSFFREAPTREPMLLVPQVLQEERRNDLDEWINRGIECDAARRGLWYGTPGVRAGEDMLGPVLNLLKRPSGLLDFRPRRSLPDQDPELLEFNRRYARSECGPDP